MISALFVEHTTGCELFDLFIMCISGLEISDLFEDTCCRV